ncbi:unnamed protein product [Acanthoscelides obtectus]|nr:unnamed protein product [Acanthoscelides obtectus]CAK1625915.1 hypothetical protein AOBTE_LOCUS3467 [Acanthoscelides obtectus]
MVKSNVDLFDDKGLYFSMQTTFEGAAEIMEKNKQKVILITFVSRNMDTELLEMAAIVAKRAYKVCWLIVVEYQFRNTVNVLKASNISINADIVAAIDLSTPPSVKDPCNYNDKSTFNDITNFAELDNTTKYVLPYFDGDDEHFDILSLCDLKQHNNEGFCLLQIYKIRMNSNNSFVLHRMGNWCYIRSAYVTKKLLSIEQRANLHRFPLIIGHRNASSEKRTTETPFLAYDLFDKNLLEFYTYFTGFLNSSESELFFAKVGSKNTEGEWTDLLGALSKGDIDLALECFIKIPAGFNAIGFTLDIMKSCKNIYLQPEASNKFRNIYLEPFDERLILCVFGTGLALSICLAITHRVAMKFKGQESYPYGIISSLTWCIGVICQQGSIWRPKLYSDQIIVLIALAFTLLIYNSYSAFITSVLSITLPDIRTVQELLESNYEIGYEKDSQTEVYLRTTNNSQLNQIYLRGYLANVQNITEGLMRAAKGGYGFFAAGEDARRALLNISHHKCRYDIQEILVKSTLNSVAFGVAKKSPYKKLINLSIIRMYETGIHKYITNILYPPLSKCDKRKTYKSARFSDISSAFWLLCLGYIFGIIFLVLECIWKNRKRVFRCLKKTSRKEHRIILFREYLP